MAILLRLQLQQVHEQILEKKIQIRKREFSSTILQIREVILFVLPEQKYVNGIFMLGHIRPARSIAISHIVKLSCMQMLKAFSMINF